MAHWLDILKLTTTHQGIVYRNRRLCIMVRCRRRMSQQRAISAPPTQIIFGPTCQPVASSSTHRLPSRHESAVSLKVRYWPSGREIVMTSNRTSTCEATDTVSQRRKLVRMRRTCYTKTTSPPLDTRQTCR